MPDILEFLRGLVWTSVSAVVMGLASVAAALGGASLETVASFSLLGLILAVLSPRQ